jgi:anti-sigma B factor antagonist
MILTITSQQGENGVVILEMAGRITMGSASQQIEWNVAELLKENRKKVIFDLTQVSFVDSSGIGILMMCNGRIKEAGGTLRIAGAQGFVEQALAVSGANRIIPLCATVVDAATGFAGD